ncbi:MAG: nitronate monooxygenase [Pseudomonadales bacterium]|jgi:enoyl-[acyl-carrier protein] reductase II|nr:nitronate monooxygenase [Pseudomonadales bacterium]
MTFRTPLCDLLHIDVPIMLAGMGGVSYAEVCAAVSNAGGYGTLGMANEGPDGIREEMKKVRDLTDRPFGVDLLTAVPESLTRSVDVIIEGGASAFIAGLGVPASILKTLHDAGLLVMSMCGTVGHAVKAAEAGVDVVIAQGTEGGGHTGKVAGMALIPQVVDAVEIPVVAAGSIVDGRGLAVALAFGCQGVWMGTRFIASHEAHADPAYKQALISALETDTVVTRCYSGKTMRVVNNDYVRDWERRPEELQPFPQQAIASARADVMGGIGGKLVGLDPSKDCMPAGQGTGAIHEVLSCREIVERTMSEAEAVMGRLATVIGR